MVLSTGSLPPRYTTNRKFCKLKTVCPASEKKRGISCRILKKALNYQHFFMVALWINLWIMWKTDVQIRTFSSYFMFYVN